MAEVVFLSGVDDKIAFACRLLRKKFREGARVSVFGPPGLLQRLDLALWQEPALDFLPHLRLRAGAALPADARRTPVWLLEAPVAGLGCDSAVNLGLDDIEALCAHAKVAEIITAEPQDHAAGQARWRWYKAAGHVLSHHPQNAPAA